LASSLNHAWIASDSGGTAQQPLLGKINCRPLRKEAGERETDMSLLDSTAVVKRGADRFKWFGVHPNIRKDPPHSLPILKDWRPYLYLLCRGDPILGQVK